MTVKESAAKYRGTRFELFWKSLLGYEIALQWAIERHDEWQWKKADRSSE